jgi:superfamily I DNA/RNA helicase
MRLRIAGYEEAAISTYHSLRTRLRRRHGKGLFTTNNPNHGGLAEFVRREATVWNDAFWHRDTQQFCTRVWRLKSSEQGFDDHGWNHVLESVCSLERTGRSSVPNRDVSRRLWLDRGWSHIA